MSNVRTQIGKAIGKSLNGYHSRVKPKIDELKFKEQYQGRIIDCMVGEVDDNYIETPLTDENVVKLEHSKEGVIKIPQIKGKTILVDADGNETDTPAEGCRLVSVGEEEDNKLIILSKNEDNSLSHKTEILLKEPLRSLPNGVKDEIVGNQIIRRIGSVTLDGDKVSSIGIINDNIVDVLYFDRIVTNKKFINYGSEGQQLIKSNIYRTGINANNWNSTTSENTLVNTNSGGFWIFLPKFTVLNIEDARNYMNNKPTEVLYELAEPITEKLPNGITLQGFDDTTMYIENSITPTVTYGYNALIPYKEELLNQKEEVETNTLDIEQNIIPYLMDMEFNLMLMEDN